MLLRFRTSSGAETSKAGFNFLMFDAPDVGIRYFIHSDFRANGQLLASKAKENRDPTYFPIPFTALVQEQLNDPFLLEIRDILNKGQTLPFQIRENGLIQRMLR